MTFIRLCEIAAYGAIGIDTLIPPRTSPSL